MSATSTHDAKRGEDARARLNILSEIPKIWDQKVKLWMRMNSSARTSIDDLPAPDRSDEYIYYQALLGAWPAGQTEVTAEFVPRMSDYLSKATKEKKIHTSWITPSPQYDEAVAEFVEQTLAGPRAQPFLAQFLPFQQRLAELGMINSLSQLTLKIASPGVPDFYQGSEVWDLNLVDPDNRHPVDYAAHQKRLAEISQRLEQTSPCCAKLAVATDLLEHWPDGGVKLFVTSQGLRVRKHKPNLFLRGKYIALRATGSAASSLVAFAREFENDLAIAVAPRLITGVTGFEQGLPLGGVWGDTLLDLSELKSPSFRNVFTGQKVKGQDGHVALAELFAKFPVALLTNFEDE
jgi:(1->4)-alpha-D-glucan 1-alpha-D-glucosylmutase